MVVTLEGAVWVYGRGGFGQLGMSDHDNRLVLMLVGTDTALEDSQVLTVSCSDKCTLAVTKDSTLWTFGRGHEGVLSRNNRNDRLVPTRIEAQHFGSANFVSVAVRFSHATAMTEKLRCPLHLGQSIRPWAHRQAGESGAHARRTTPAAGRARRTLPRSAADARPRLCHAMGTHARLGSATTIALSAGGGSQRSPQRQHGNTPASADKVKGCEFVTMPSELVQRVVEACVWWPEGQAGELEGWYRCWEAV